MKKPRVLFLCTHNQARSQMAEAWLRAYGSDRFEAHSAGLEPLEIHPLTRQVLSEAGLDISGQRSKGLDEYIAKIHVGYLVTVCTNAEKNCPVYPGVGVRLYWPFEDPVTFAGGEEEKLAKFRHVRDQIKERVLEWLAEGSAHG